MRHIQQPEFNILSYILQGMQSPDTLKKFSLPTFAILRDRKTLCLFVVFYSEIYNESMKAFVNFVTS